MSNLSNQTGLGIAQTAVTFSEAMEGVPYKLGGKDERGLDCSGFVTYVFKMVFPEKATQFVTSAAGFSENALFEKVTEPVAGDLIFFKRSEEGQVHHVGIVLNNQYWVGSQSSTGVAKVSFKNPYWSKEVITYGRYKHSSPQAINAYLASLKK
ncbi:MAG: NlpC/P60 family protein [Limnobacter sp.]|nr:NlpC/P60 family protein [Limnobacter sp.]